MRAQKGSTRNTFLSGVWVLGMCWLIAQMGCEGSEASTQAPAFAGERIHDFGTVMLEDAAVQVHHTFRLVNQRDKVVRIVHSSTTCGCAVASVSAKDVSPGDTVEINARLRLTRRSIRRETIKLLLDDGDIVLLTLQGEAVRRREVVASAASIDLETSDREQIVLMAFSEEGGPPPPAPRVFEVPDGVQVETGPWKAVGGGGGAMTARRYHCVVAVDRVGSTRALREWRMHIDVKGWNAVIVRTSGTPWE